MLEHTLDIASRIFVLEQEWVNFFCEGTDINSLGFRAMQCLLQLLCFFFFFFSLESCHRWYIDKWAWCGFTKAGCSSTWTRDSRLREIRWPPLSLRNQARAFMTLDPTKEIFQIPFHGLQGSAWPEHCLPLSSGSTAPHYLLSFSHPFLPSVLSHAEHLATSGLLHSCSSCFEGSTWTGFQFSSVQKLGRFFPLSPAFTK